MGRNVAPPFIPGWFEEFPEQILEAIENGNRKTHELLKQILDATRQAPLNESSMEPLAHSHAVPRRESLKSGTPLQSLVRTESPAHQTGPEKEAEELGKLFLSCCKENNFFFRTSWEKFISCLSGTPQVKNFWYDRMSRSRTFQPGEAGEDSNKVDCRLLSSSLNNKTCYLFSALVGVPNPHPDEFLCFDLNGGAHNREPSRITSYTPLIVIDGKPTKNGQVVYD